MPQTMPKITELIEAEKSEIARRSQKVRLLEEAARVAGELQEDGSMPRTFLQMAQIVLTEKGKETHTAELSAEIQRKFGVHIKPTSLGTMLYRAAVERDTGVFVKSKTVRNSYGLKEWDASSGGSRKK